MDRLAPLTLQLARAGPQAPLRNGDVVEARVIAMLAGDIAQLEILGRTMEVSTPKALKVGTTISVAINRAGRSLELIIQPETEVTAPAGVIRERPSNHAMETGMPAARAAINHAMLSSEISQRAALASPSNPNQQGQPANVPVLAETLFQSAVRTRYGLEITPPAGNPHSETVAAHKPAEPTQPPASLTTFARPAGKAAAATAVPFQLPQMPHPVVIEIGQDDENKESPAGPSIATKRWSVNFSLDAGTLGAVQVNIGLCDDAVSVGLSGEAESALCLTGLLPELKASLERADFTVEGLSVRERDSDEPQP